MMLWLVLLPLSLVFVGLGTQMKAADDVYALALYAAGVLSGLWGMAIAPDIFQVLLGVLTLIGWQLSSR